MSERFFVDAAITTERATLRGAEAHHLLHVMRAKTGDEVQLFDGSGSQFTARVEQLSRSQVELVVLIGEAVDRESTVALTLAVALPKGDRQRWLVEKAVELGVTRIVPLSTKRSVAEISAATLDRLRRIVVEASKQCGRNRLLEITEPQNWQQAIESFRPEYFANSWPTPEEAPSELVGAWPQKASLRPRSSPRSVPRGVFPRKK